MSKRENRNWALHRISWKLTFRKFTICVIFRIKFNFLFSLTSTCVCVFVQFFSLSLLSSNVQYFRAERMKIKKWKGEMCRQRRKGPFIWIYRQMRHENYCVRTNCDSYKFNSIFFYSLIVIIMDVKMCWVSVAGGGRYILKYFDQLASLDQSLWKYIDWLLRITYLHCWPNALNFNFIKGRVQQIPNSRLPRVMRDERCGAISAMM